MEVKTRDQEQKQKRDCTLATLQISLINVSKRTEEKYCVPHVEKGFLHLSFKTPYTRDLPPLEVKRQTKCAAPNRQVLLRKAKQTEKKGL